MSMEDWIERKETVDPEVRAYVGSLVNAVGGTNIEGRGGYVLGDDAIGCLKDLRRWIRFYDEKLNRLDVQRVLAESNFVKGDLLEMLADWPETSQENRLRSKIALLALELLVPLTWTLDVSDIQMTAHHHKHLPYLRLAQVEYKRAILQHDSKNILRQIVRVALPSMAEEKADRSIRDDGIIRLVLYAIRNIAMISAPTDIPVDGDETEISKSTTIDAFHKQDIFQMILAVASSMGDEFDSQDVVLLEVLFHLLKGIDPDKLFMKDAELAQTNTGELKELLRKEKAMLTGYAKHAPSRHNRFGTMMWLKNGEKISTLSGQRAISGPDRGLKFLDKAKKVNKPRYNPRSKEEIGSFDFNRETNLTNSARKQLAGFIKEFLDTSFNPLFMHVRRSIERELDRVMESHKMQFFYLIGWFLKAECARREAEKADTSNPNTAAKEDDGYAVVAGVMNQETFVLLNKYLQSSYDSKAWNDVNAGMKCFSQILLTVHQMEESPKDYDQEIAENIQSRLFYESSTHDLVVNLLRNYKHQGRGYLDAVTELAHVFIRMLERYSKQNADMQIRSKRKTKNNNDKSGQQREDDESDGEIERTRILSSERKFDFVRFSGRFLNQACIDTFVAFTRYYQDLTDEQLKRAHRFFYRAAFKHELTTLLFRVDIIQLFNSMIKGENALDHNLSCFKEWEELVRQLFKRLVKRVQDRPELIVEMLFSKIPSSLFYLEHGYDREVTKNAPRPPAQLEVHPDISAGDRIALVTEVLLSKGDLVLCQWIKDQLEKAIVELETWEKAEALQKERSTSDNQIQNREESQDHLVEQSIDDPKPPVIFIETDDSDVRSQMFKNSRLRLLMELVGFSRVEDTQDVPGASWIVSKTATSVDLTLSLSRIQNAERADDVLANYPDHKPADWYLRRKANSNVTAAAQARGRLAEDVLSSEPDDDESLDEALLFPAGGPTARKPDHTQEPKKKRRLRRKNDDANENEEAARLRAKGKKKTELEKRLKIKSDLYVHASDDESDEERDQAFLELEAKRRQNAESRLMAAATAVTTNGKKRKGDDADGEREKRRRASEEDLSSDADVMEQSDLENNNSDIPLDSEEDTSDEESSRTMKNASQSSVHSDERSVLSGVESNKENLIRGSKDIDMADVGDHQLQKSAMPVRRNIRAGFIIDSDSE